MTRDTIEILRMFMRAAKNGSSLPMMLKCLQGGHAAISASADHKDGRYDDGAEKRFEQHQKWTRAVLATYARINEEYLVYGFFPKGLCYELSLFGDELYEPDDTENQRFYHECFKSRVTIVPQMINGFCVSESVELNNIVIGWGIPFFRVEVVYTGDTSKTDDLNDEDWGSVAQYKAETGVFSRKSSSGRHEYKLLISKTGRCVPIPPAQWDQADKIITYHLHDEPEDECQEETEEDFNEPELIYIEGTDEVRRHVNGVWQHKHPDTGYDYWHPMARLHKWVQDSIDT